MLLYACEITAQYWWFTYSKFQHYIIGDAVAPVADCSKEEFAAHPKSDMRVADYLDYWRDYAANGHPQDGSCLYLKDWHFKR